MMKIWTAVFVVIGAHFGRAMNHRSEAEGPIRLDMAPNSVDDMYNGCDKEMKETIVKTFLPNELNKNPTFQKAWKKAEEYYNEKWKHGKRKSKREKEQIMAVYAYTLDEPKLYSEFNDAVRKQKPEYKTTFEYHTMHYFLTRAIQTLNPGKKCTTAYRKVHEKFSPGDLNKEFRFSSFTSSSLGTYITGDKYGDTCFEIYTCFGANIEIFSKYGESEREVLIPPYEVFKYIGPGTEEKEKECKVVYKVKSTEKSVSNLNCAFFSQKKEIVVIK